MRYKILDQFGLNFLTFTVVDWVDVFIRPHYKDIIIDSLDYCQQNKGLKVYAYAIMTSHVHLIVQAKGKIPLSDIIRDFKKYTASTLLEMIHNDKKRKQAGMVATTFSVECKATHRK